jgi:hypothetical protein
MSTAMPRPNFCHIIAMTDRFGTYEHADNASPRREHGYCVDDVARVLVVTTRERQLSGSVHRLAQGALEFVSDSQGLLGDCRNRRAADGRWTSDGSVEDCWGRSLWGLGTAAANGHGRVAVDALSRFEHGAQLRSAWPRAMAFAALGATAVAQLDPENVHAVDLLEDAVVVLGDAQSDPIWPWPEPRLAYANAVLPDAMMAAGSILQRPELVQQGLALLGWLLTRETRDGHLSVTPVGGSGPSDAGPGFDQQPIEIATMADACARAMTLDDSPDWPEGIRMAAAWFDGDNDGRVEMWDPATAGGFDGLEAESANVNQGAESTLALISTRQQASRLVTLSA